MAQGPVPKSECVRRSVKFYERRDEDRIEIAARDRWLDWLAGAGRRAFVVFDRVQLVRARL